MMMALHEEITAKNTINWNSLIHYAAIKILANMNDNNGNKLL